MSYKALQLVSRYQFPAFLACKFNGKPFNFRGSTLKTVFYELAKYLNPDGFEGWASYSTLAEGSGLSQRTVILAVKALELLGLLEKQKRIERKGNHCPNIYRFTKKIYECDSQRHASTAQGLCSGFITKRVKENSNINNISNARARDDEPELHSPTPTDFQPEQTKQQVAAFVEQQQTLDQARNTYSSTTIFQNRWQIPTEGFKKFWQAYPRKTNFANALKSWNYNGLEAQLDKILADIEWRKQHDPDWKKIESTQHPRTYLENKRWLEEKVIIGKNIEKSVAASKLGGKPAATDYLARAKENNNNNASLENLITVVKGLINKFGVPLFVSKYPADCLDEWARVASEHSDKTLKEALTLIPKYHPTYPPTPIEFDALCRKTEAFNEIARETKIKIVSGGCESCKNPERPAKHVDSRKLCFYCHEHQQRGKTPLDWRTPEFEARIIKLYPNSNFFDYSKRAGQRETARRLEYLYLYGEQPPQEVAHNWNKEIWKELQ